MIVTLTVIVILLSLLTQCEWVRQVLGWPQHQVLKCTLAGSLQEDMACKQLECGNKDVPMAPLWPLPQPTARAWAPSHGCLRAQAMLGLTVMPLSPRGHLRRCEMGLPAQQNHLPLHPPSFRHSQEDATSISSH